MKSPIVSMLTCLGIACFAGLLQGQMSTAISKELRSTDWVERQDAYGVLAAGKSLSTDAKTALVDLLQREDQVLYEANRLDKLEEYGEGYAEYLGRLGDTVYLIA